MISSMRWVCLAVVAALSMGCQPGTPSASGDQTGGLASPGPTASPTAQMRDVRVRVTNQSFTVTPVDIRIVIDGKELVNKSFAVGDQHVYESFYTKLAEGEHQATIESRKGLARQDVRFTITRQKRWVDVAFATDPKTALSLFVADEDRLID